MAKRKWERSGCSVHDGFMTIKCDNEIQARKLMEVLSLVYVEGQQSVIRSIADLSKCPMPTEQAQC